MKRCQKCHGSAPCKNQQCETGRNNLARWKKQAEQARRRRRMFSRGGGGRRRSAADYLSGWGYGSYTDDRPSEETA